MNTTNIIFTIICAVICIGVFIPQLRSKCKIKNSEKIYLAAIILIIALAVIIRVYKFGSVPGGINQDGAMAGVDAKALAEYGTDRLGMRYPVHFTAWGFGQMSVLMSYMMIPFIKIMGLNAISLRLPTLLVSLAGLALLYLFCRDAFGKWHALAVLFIAAISPWHIMQSRWALDCNLLPHFFIAAVYFLYRAIKCNRQMLNLAVSMVLFGLCMYCYGISIYTVTLFLFIACIWLLFSKRISFKRAAAAFIIYIAVAWPFIMCMAINALGGESIETSLFTIPYFPNTLRSSDILFFADNIPEQFLSNLKCTFRIIFQTYGDSLSNMIPGFGTLYVFSVPFILLGFIYCIAQCRKNEASILIMIFFLVGIIDGAITKNVNVNRLNLIFYPLIIFCGMGIYISIDKLRYAALIPTAIMYLAVFCVFTNTYFTTYADEISDVFLKDFGQALTSLKDSDVEKIYITPDSQFSGASYVSEILTLYYQDIDAQYFCSSDYNSRYIYKNVSEDDIQENAAYVVGELSAMMFDANEYNIIKFGRFYAITPK